MPSPQHQSPSHRRFERHSGREWRLSNAFVILRPPALPDDGLGREAMADGIATGASLAFVDDRPGAPAGIATVGLDLPKSRHWVIATIGFVLHFGGPSAAAKGVLGLAWLWTVAWADSRSGARQPIEPGAFSPTIPPQRDKDRC